MGMISYRIIGAPRPGVGTFFNSLNGIKREMSSILLIEIRSVILPKVLKISCSTSKNSTKDSSNNRFFRIS